MSSRVQTFTRITRAPFLTAVIVPVLLGAVIAWVFLTFGILLGGWWSYEVLGWGGYWGWDPVENASLMPWLVATAYLHSIMVDYGIHTVYHAAAYKHVPIVEHNPIAGINNNVFGTLSAAEAALSAQIETFVLISTDKAVRPSNTMGASKRVAELLVQAIQTDTRNQGPKKTRFETVRFGNVLESSGSVVPLFREQIRSGGPVTVTHRKIIRYFMTIPEASQLVIQAAAMARGGDVFVLDMGEPLKILDLAHRMISLMGLTVRDESNPDGDIEISYTGLRPAEKLYEELLDRENDIKGFVAEGRDVYLKGTKPENFDAFNAAVAEGRSPADLAAPFDLVSVALSKGLGAPGGSLFFPQRGSTGADSVDQIFYFILIRLKTKGIFQFAIQLFRFL